MTKSKYLIAIVVQNTLTRLGLEWLVRSNCERCTIDLYDDFDRLDRSVADLYDVIYIDASLLLLNRDCFRARKAKVVALLSDPTLIDKIGDLAALQDEYTYLHTLWPRPEIERVINESLQASASPKVDVDADKRLSLRELDVLKEVARGLTNKEIADVLSISMNTVMSHRKNITAKLNIKTVPGLTFYALMNGLISGEEVVEGGTVE